uniref:Uncharacterized protein n=1 Tax=Anguilla anguilla TaxID=7936 RepID=A0A0E9S078_ANGAN
MSRKRTRFSKSGLKLKM